VIVDQCPQLLLPLRTGLMNKLLNLIQLRVGVVQCVHGYGCVCVFFSEMVKAGAELVSSRS
jgi:hypothetical protein